MSNAALTAKYRPQTFADVAGQETLKAILSRASLENRVAPAYLFSGTRGVGKTTLARIFAKALNCRTAPTAEPCNECDQCRAVTTGTAVDVIEIDGASNRGIDDVRRLKEVVGYAPMEGRYKVFIIDEAHMLSREAFNALLKTLEEPPANVTFIMATTEPHKFPATIISRCQHYVFKRLPENELIAHLVRVLGKEGMEFEERAVRLIARRGAGSVRDSMSLLSQVLALGNGTLTEDATRGVLGLAGQDVFTSLVASLGKGETLPVVELLRELLDQGLDIGFFLRELAGLWRNLFILRQSGRQGLSAVDAPLEEAEALLALAEEFSLTHIHASWQMTLEGQRRVLTSLEPGLALELLLLNLAMLPQLLPLDAVSALARKQAGPRPGGRGGSSGSNTGGATGDTGGNGGGHFAGNSGTPGSASTPPSSAFSGKGHASYHPTSASPPHTQGSSGSAETAVTSVPPAQSLPSEPSGGRVPPLHTASPFDGTPQGGASQLGEHLPSPAELAHSRSGEGDACSPDAHAYEDALPEKEFEVARLSSAHERVNKSDDLEQKAASFSSGPNALESVDEQDVNIASAKGQREFLAQNLREGDGADILNLPPSAASSTEESSAPPQRGEHSSGDTTLKELEAPGTLDARGEPDILGAPEWAPPSSVDGLLADSEDELEQALSDKATTTVTTLLDKPSWERIAEFILRDEKALTPAGEPAPAWFRALINGATGFWDENALVVKPKESFSARRLKENEARTLFEYMLNILCGAVPKITVLEAETKLASHEELRKKVFENESVQAIESSFEAKILDYGQIR